MARGYCGTSDVENYLGASFTGTQASLCASLITRVETLIDAETGRSWLSGSVGSEVHYEPWPLVLKNAPIVSVQQVLARSGTSEITLAADSDYEIEDADEGTIRLDGASAYNRFRVNYTPASAVPEPIRQACIEWTAFKMQPSLRTDVLGIESFTLPDYSVKFTREFAYGNIPTSVREVLDMYAYPSDDGIG
jgi:hypothetical protein